MKLLAILDKYGMIGLPMFACILYFYVHWGLALIPLMVWGLLAYLRKTLN